MADTHVNRLRCAVSAVASAGLGAFTISTASSGYRAFGASQDGQTFTVLVTEGAAWEVNTGCTYTHSGTSLARGTLADSSTGSAITFTTAAVITEVASAAFGNALELHRYPGVVIVENNGSTAQAISSATFAKLTTALATETLDENGWWDTTNKKFLPTRAGKYLISAAAALVAMNDSKLIIISLYKNGAEHKRLDRKDTGQGTSTLLASGTAIVEMNGSTDYIEVYLYNGDSVSRNTEAAAASVWFSAKWVSE